MRKNEEKSYARLPSRPQLAEPLLHADAKSDESDAKAEEVVDENDSKHDTLDKRLRKNRCTFIVLAVFFFVDIAAAIFLLEVWRTGPAALGA